MKTYKLKDLQKAFKEGVVFVDNTKVQTNYIYGRTLFRNRTVVTDIVKPLSDSSQPLGFHLRLGDVGDHCYIRLY